MRPKDKFYDRSMEVKLPALLGNYDRLTEQPTDRQTGSWGNFTFNKKKYHIKKECTNGTNGKGCV